MTDNAYLSQIHAEELDKFGLAYLHLIEPRASGAGQHEVDHKNVPSAVQLFRSMWHGILIIAGNFNGESANAMLGKGDADAIAFGRSFISNHDLPASGRGLKPLRPSHILRRWAGRLS